MTRCLVTDRRRLAGPHASQADAVSALLAQVQRAVRSGVELVQIRERDLEAGELEAIVTRGVAMTRGTGTRLLVNDRLDVALACGADGVHLRGDSLSVAAARRLAPPGFIISRAVHGAGDVDDSSGADYLIAGTVFPTVSKPAATVPLGLDGLAKIVRVSKAPVLAIGGVTADRVAEIAATGAAGIAGIGFFMQNCEPDV